MPVACNRATSRPSGVKNASRSGRSASFSGCARHAAQRRGVRTAPPAPGRPADATPCCRQTSGRGQPMPSRRSRSQDLKLRASQRPEAAARQPRAAARSFQRACSRLMYTVRVSPPSPSSVSRTMSRQRCTGGRSLAVAARQHGRQVVEPMSLDEGLLLRDRSSGTAACGELFTKSGGERLSPTGSVLRPRLVTPVGRSTRVMQR